MKPKKPLPPLLKAWGLIDSGRPEQAFELFRGTFNQAPSAEAWGGAMLALHAQKEPAQLLRQAMRTYGAMPPPRSELEAKVFQELCPVLQHLALSQPLPPEFQRSDRTAFLQWLSRQINSKPKPNPKEKPKAAPKPAPPPPEPPPKPRLTPPSIQIEVSPHLEPTDLLERLADGCPSSADDWRLLRQVQGLSMASSFEELLCLDSLHGVETLGYQIQTARRVLRVHRGRALLADEVGLGKTIEACLVLKEYLLRGLVEKFLILCPPSLIPQWQAELAEKFEIACATTADEQYRSDAAAFWRTQPAIIASLHTAKSGRNAEILQELEFDLVIVDEAHHLKNRATVSWKFVNALRRKFLLLLTATPVQNELAELYNLITLLRPGTLGTPAQFRDRFVASGKKNEPKDPEALRRLMGSVMIRNTRSVADLKLPPRRATTYHVTQSKAAAQVYAELSDLLRKLYPKAAPKEKLVYHALLARAGSGLVALGQSLDRFSKSPSLDEQQSAQALSLSRKARELASGEAKLQRLLQLLEQGPGKKIVFTQFRDTLDFLHASLLKAGIQAVAFHGGLTVEERARAIEAFKTSASVLLCTEAGSEGQNLQFARTVINYDLPWNPMRIEQRIGRVHRFGQTEPVYVFNLALAGSIESFMLQVLEQKINLFELVVGELGVILGNLTEDQDFPDRVLEIWLGSTSEAEAQRKFHELGENLATARTEFEASSALDGKIFGRDFEA